MAAVPSAGVRSAARPSLTRGADDRGHCNGGARAACADRLPEPAHRAVLRRAQERRPRRVRVHLRRRRFLAGVRELAVHRDRHDGDRRAARRAPRIRDGAHRPAGQAMARADDPRAELRVADGAVVRLCRRRRAGRVLQRVGERSLRRRTVGPLLGSSDGGDRGPDARAERLRLRVGCAQEPRVRRRGSGAHSGRVAVSRRDDGEPAVDHAVAAVRCGARVLPRLRAVRPAAGARRPRRPSGAVDVSVQAHEQARHAVVSPDGRGRDVHRRRDVPARPAAAPPAAERPPLRDDQGQGRAAARPAARQVEMACRALCSSRGSS